MIKIGLIILAFTFSINGIAQNIVDVYGVDHKEGEYLIKKYSAEISIIEREMQDEFKKTNANIDAVKITQLKKEKLKEEIKKYGSFSYVDINTIYYPANKNYYSTIEIINHDQADRRRFLDNTKPQKYPLKNDLINKMIVFRNMEFKLILTNQLNVEKIPCPVYHCVTAFTHPQLKPWLAIFNTGVINERKLILETLNTDPNPERRAAAAFLIGHFHDPKEIISLLLPHVTDSNSGVRNNVMRVIGATLFKAKINTINVQPFIDLLDSPETTDRNKALYILLGAVDSPLSKKLVIQQAGKKLLALLELKQPNNHDISYEILKKVSGKDFGDTNSSLWKDWHSHQK